MIHVGDNINVIPKVEANRGVVDVTTRGKKYDNDKIRYDLLDPSFEELVAKVLTFGAKKYGDHNWKNVANKTNRYYAAMRRHIASWRQGEILDSESGLPHLAHAACCLYFLIEDNKDRRVQCECK